MPDSTPLEIVFYVHGVSPTPIPQDHDDEYKCLHKGIAAAGVDSAWPDVFGGAEWGWNFDRGDAKSHKALAQAQNVYGDLLLPKISGRRDFTLNPARLLVNGMRELMFFGFGDMFYYVSSDGKWAVRHAIATQIVQHLQSQSALDSQPVSLTLLGHSAGSVIAFDFLYYVFSRRKHHYLPPSAAAETVQGLERLREMAKQGRLRLRRLVTFGSPISLVAFRSDAVVEILARGENLRPDDYGLKSSISGQSALTGPRWINLWDKDDPIAWPIEPLMESPLAKDLYLDVSDSVAKAHNMYWESASVHKTIAEIW